MPVEQGVPRGNPIGQSFGPIEVTLHCMLRYKDRICNNESRFGLMQYDLFALVAFEFSLSKVMPYAEQLDAIHTHRWRCSDEDFARSRFYRNDKTSNVFVCIPENDKFVLSTCWRDSKHVKKWKRPDKFDAIRFREIFRKELEVFRTGPAAA